MANDELALYRRWLRCGIKANKTNDKQYVQDSFVENIQTSPAYQEDALVNGAPQPIVATRKNTKKCRFTVLPGDDLHIGDLVYVFKEYWICVELYIDEFGMKYGELWMCNQIFRYQDHDLNVIEKYAILDDGSYSKDSEKAILVTDNSFTCYISLDDESKALYVDKRLAIGTIYNAKGAPILEVGKIKWIDVKSRNFGEGSHLMLFGINDDPFNEEADNIEELICDYQEKEEPAEPTPPTATMLGYLGIEGRTKLRIGSGRTYTATAVDIGGDSVAPPSDLTWSIDVTDGTIEIQPAGDKCVVSVKEDDDLSGVKFVLKCVSAAGEYEEAQIEVEVT